MSFIFTMMMIYWGINSIETYFDKRQADLATLILFNATIALVFAWLADDALVMQDKFVFSLIYVWSKLVPDQPTAIWGFQFKSCNLPWVLMVYHLLTGHNPFSDLIGVATGHSYIYLKMVLPESHGYDLLKTPLSIEKLVAKINDLFADAPRNNRVYGLNNNGGQANVGVVNAEGNPLNRLPRNARDNNDGGGAAFRAFGGRGVRIGGDN